MKILSTEQIREADSYTIKNEPISSLNLMERASKCFSDWFADRFPNLFEEHKIAIVCGTGNNGGDGLAVARMLFEEHDYDVDVFVVRNAPEGSTDFDANMKRIFELPQLSLRFLRESDEMPQFGDYHVVIDALLGSGINRPAEGFLAKLIQHINQTGKEIVSIDVPSGLFADQPTHGPCIKATHTFTFESPKLAFFFPESGEYVGDWSCQSIGLHPDYLTAVETPFRMLEWEMIEDKMKPRGKFSHKGDYGHALMVAGSYGKMGAALLSTRACLRAGAGLVTAHIPGCGYTIMQTGVPEAMVLVDEDMDSFTRLQDGFERFNVIGIGPGLSTRNKTRNAVCFLLKNYFNPVVLDADALNILSDAPDWIQYIPKGSVLTPHPKEFERLFGPSENSFERNALQRKMAQELQVVIVLKGANTAIAMPDGTCYFNTSGNPGMATAGSGDVLTGIITALIAQGYSSEDAALIGVFWHGVSGDFAASRKGEISLIAGDLVRYLGLAWKRMELGTMGF